MHLLFTQWFTLFYFELHHFLFGSLLSTRLHILWISLHSWKKGFSSIILMFFSRLSRYMYCHWMLSNWHEHRSAVVLYGHAQEYLTIPNLALYPFPCTHTATYAKWNQPRDHTCVPQRNSHFVHVFHAYLCNGVRLFSYLRLFRIHSKFGCTNGRLDNR